MPGERLKWTSAEHALLKDLVEKGPNPTDWRAVAACLPRRNEQECRKRWQSKLAVQTKTGAWSTEEDESLRQAVAKHGLSWVLVASKVGNRSGDQCFKRWNDAVNPELDHSPWLPVDDEWLLRSVEKHGRNWKLISGTAPKLRAPLALKNRYSLLVRRSNRAIKVPSTSGSPSEGASFSASRETSLPADIAHSKKRISSNEPDLDESYDDEPISSRRKVHYTESKANLGSSNRSGQPRRIINLSPGFNKPHMLNDQSATVPSENIVQRLGSTPLEAQVPIDGLPAAYTSRMQTDNTANMIYSTYQPESHPISSACIDHSSSGHYGQKTHPDSNMSSSNPQGLPYTRSKGLPEGDPYRMWCIVQSSPTSNVTPGTQLSVPFTGEASTGPLPPPIKTMETSTGESSEKTVMVTAQCPKGKLTALVQAMMSVLDPAPIGHEPG